MERGFYCSLRLEQFKEAITKAINKDLHVNLDFEGSELYIRLNKLHENDVLDVLKNSYKFSDAKVHDYYIEYQLGKDIFVSIAEVSDFIMSILGLDEVAQVNPHCLVTTDENDDQIITILYKK